MIRKIRTFFKYFTLHFDRSFSKSQTKQVYWLTGFMAVCFLVLVLLSLVPGLYDPAPGLETRGRFFDIMFLLFDPGNFTDSMSGMFIIIGALVGIILFIGCLISVISNMLANRVEMVRGGETWYRLDGHVVIIGYNRSVPSLIHSIYEKTPSIREGSAFIVIMSELPSEQIRSDLHVANTDSEENCVLLLHGQRTAMDELEKLSLAGCRTIYLLGEENETAHDSTNLECLTQLSRLLPERKTGLPDCHVQFDEQTLFSVFQFSDISQEVLRRVNFIPYNFYDVWAQKVLVKCEAEDGLIGSDYTIHYVPIDGEKGIRKDSEKHVHLIVIGMSQMGEAIALQAAHIAHFPNFRKEDNSTRTHITFIDTAAHAGMDRLKTRFRGMFSLARWRFVREEDATYCLEGKGWHDPLSDEDSPSPYRYLGPNFLDLQWEFIEGEYDSDSIQQYLLASSLDESALCTVAFCQDDQNEALRSSLYMPYQAYDNLLQVLVYQNSNPAIVHNLSGFSLPEDMRQKLRYHRMKPFGMSTEFHVGDLDSEKYGRLVNVAYSYDPQAGLDGLRKQLADADKVEIEWNRLSMANKWSSTYCANMRYVKLRFIGCDLETSTIEEIEKAMRDNIEDIKLVEHNRWNVEKLLMGFRPLTPEESRFDNARKKILRKSSQMAHLDICSYEMLCETDAATIVYDASVNMALPVMIDIIRNSKNKQS